MFAREYLKANIVKNTIPDYDSFPAKFVLLLMIVGMGIGIRILAQVCNEICRYRIQGNGGGSGHRHHDRQMAVLKEARIARLVFFLPVNFPHFFCRESTYSNSVILHKFSIEPLNPN